MSSFMSEVAQAVRGLGRAPSFTLAAVVTLALAVGANTAIFAVVHTVLLRPLPFPEPERLVRLEERHGSGTRLNLTAATFRDVQEAASSFSSLAVFRAYPFNLSGGRAAEPVTAVRVTEEFFAALGGAPLQGRYFVPEEHEAGAGHVAILSEGLWRRYLGGDTTAIGGRVRLDGEDHVVVGVLPDRFRFPEDGDVWLPMVMDRRPANRRSHLLTTVGRLEDGVTLSQAQQELSALAPRIREESGTRDDLQDFAATPLRERLTEAVRPAIVALFGAVGLLLLVACVNLASLLLARGARRGREMAIRGALGASRWRVARQLMTESLVLAVLASLPGALLAYLGTRALRSLVPVDVPRVGSLGMDPTVLLFALGLSLVASVLFGLWPALQAARGDIRGALQSGSPGSAGPARARLRAALIVAEVAVVVVLLGGTGLLARTFLALQEVPLGFEGEDVTTFYVSPGGRAYDSAAGQAAFLDEVLGELRALPGVSQAAVASGIPSERIPWTRFAVEGRDPEEENPGADVLGVSPGFFRLLGIPLMRGRPIEERDGLEAAPVVVLSQSAAESFWPGQDPVDRRITLLHWDEPLEARVVGVVGDVRLYGPTEPAGPAVYYSHRQFADRVVGWHYLVKSPGDAATLATANRGSLARVDAEQPLARLSTMDAVTSRHLAPRRFNAALVALFAILALALTVVGIYGLISWTVGERQREIGIRLALGALPRALLWRFAWRGVALALLGLALGLPATLAAGRAVASLLFEVEPWDPVTLLGLAVVVPVVGLAAAWLPARRAAGMDPVEALRTE